MNPLKTLITALAVLLLFIGCQKELSREQQFSEGILKEDGSGNCLPFTVNGVFKEDSLLNTTHFVEVQVNITETGSFIIKTDTINGYSFSGAGTIDVPGLSTVRLAASGRPVDPGINSFTVNFTTPAGSSSCFMDVTVITVGPPATYTLGSTGSSCIGALVSGTYAVGIPVGAGNTASVNVNVTVAGSYTLSTPVVNGVSFSSSSDFVSTGPQTVVLAASGTPTAAGVVNFAVSGGGTQCIFPVTITGAPSAAVFTLGGAGSNCTGFALAGTYAAGTALGVSNTVSLNVNVTTVGAYTISTTPINGVTFNSTGVFATTGPQLVTLTGSGTPTAAGPITHIVNAGTNTCSFSITYTGAAAQAVYTLSGGPGACTVGTVAGTYAAGTPLTAANTVTVQVNVTTVGAYTLTTAAVNGMTFSKSGTFTTTGMQNVVLTGIGTPSAGGTNTFTPQAGASNCTFTITVTGTAPADFITAKINGVDKVFNYRAGAVYFTPNQELYISGDVNPTSDETILFGVNKDVGAGPLTTGTYTVAGGGLNYEVVCEYTDAAGTFYLAILGSPFTITITTLTPTRVIGTFSGTVLGFGTEVATITNGVFNVAIR